MLRRRWEAMERLHEVTPPEGDSRKSHARKVAREVILGRFPSTLSHKGEFGVITAAHILINLSEQGDTVVARQDATDVADIYAKESFELNAPEVRREAESWFDMIGLEEVDSSYSEKWHLHENIWVARLGPHLADIVEEHGNPPAVSIDTIRSSIERAFETPARNYESNYGSLLELDEKKLDSYLALIRMELDDEWAPIRSSTQQVWANPEVFNEVLARADKKLSTSEVVTTIAETLSNVSNIDDDLTTEDAVSKSITQLMAELEEHYDWWHLTTREGTRWYSSEIALDPDYQKHGSKAKQVLDDPASATDEELQTAKNFYKYNQELLLELEWINTPEGLEGAVRKLRAEINTRKEEARMEMASHGESEIETVFEAETPTLYHVAKELDEQYEEMKKAEREEEDGELSGKGLNNYQY